MHELTAILDAWQGLEGSNKDAVLATVVHVRGSAYRRPGARMLLAPDGLRAGTISGGCLEGEISRKAWWFTSSGAPALRVYDTTSSDDAVWEFGLGCNGIIEVLLERVVSPEPAAMLQFLNARRGMPSVIATVVRSVAGNTGDRLLFDPAGRPAGALASHPEALALAAEVLAARESRLVHLPDMDLFVEYVAPPQSLVIFGAGHDAVPVCAIAAELGWQVTVADGRPAYARPDRFPHARAVVTLSPANPLKNIPIGRSTAVVMMTHNFPLDTRLLPFVLQANPKYLGLLGPRERACRLFAEIGLDLPDSVHAPVGLDLGASCPSAIALSIVSEVQAALHNRAGCMLKFRSGPIHAPAPEYGLGGLLSPLAEAVRPAYCETALP